MYTTGQAMVAHRGRPVRSNAQTGRTPTLTPPPLPLLARRGATAFSRRRRGVTDRAATAAATAANATAAANAARGGGADARRNGVHPPHARLGQVPPLVLGAPTRAKKTPGARENKEERGSGSRAVRSVSKSTHTDADHSMAPPRSQPVLATVMTGNHTQATASSRTALRAAVAGHSTTTLGGFRYPPSAAPHGT